MLPNNQANQKIKKVLLLENIDGNARELFIKEGYMVEEIKGALSEEELIQKIGDVSIVGIRSKTEITKKVLAAAKALRAIGAFCIGINQIDLSDATQRGIVVFNAPYSNTRSVVELILAEIIMLSRKVFDKSVGMHQGKWDKASVGSFEIRGKKLGIIGYGNIGTQLAILAENLGMQVYFYDIEDKLIVGNVKRCHTLHELLSIVDIVTIHVDGATTNKNLIGEQEFQRMKDGVIFLNASRGFVVDIDALVHAIQVGKVIGAAIDVFPTEPKNNREPFVSPLQGLPNVILTPHIGGSTEEAQKDIGEFVTTKIIKYMNTGSTILSINFPMI